MEEIKNNEHASGQTIIVNQIEKKSNGIGTAGFVIAIISLFIGWIPFVGWVIWFLGLIFSFIGLFKSPKGFAIAGLVISLFWIVIFVFLMGMLGLSSLAQ